MPDSEPVLKVERVSYGYGGAPVVRGISIRAKAGELTAIVGPNGAGKSTLMKGIVGVLPASDGHVWLNGEEITRNQPEDLIRSGIAYVPQVANVFPSLSVYENLELGGYIKRGDMKGRIGEVCDMFPDLIPALKRPARTLSGGQRMMLALARGLVVKPVLLMLDEPTAGLAPLIVDKVWDHVIAIKNTGVAVLVVEQNTRRSLRDAEWGYVLTTGQNNLEGPGPELLANEDLVRLYIGGAASGDGPESEGSDRPAAAGPASVMNQGVNQR